MASLAGQTFVAAGEWKIRVVVIELPPGPAIGVVALFAGLPQSALVVVVIAVATYAGGCFRFIAAIGVAALAIRQCVHAVERHAGEIVIKTHVFKPATGFMTLLTLLSQFCAMNVIASMAIDTGTRLQPRINAIGMAVIATGVLMGAVQREVGIHVVIEFGTTPVVGAVAIVALVAIASAVDVVTAMTVNASTALLIGWLTGCVAA